MVLLVKGDYEDNTGIPRNLSVGYCIKKGRTAKRPFFIWASLKTRLIKEKTDRNILGIGIKKPLVHCNILNFTFF